MYINSNALMKTKITFQFDKNLGYKLTYNSAKFSGQGKQGMTYKVLKMHIDSEGSYKGHANLGVMSYRQKSVLRLGGG